MLERIYRFEVQLFENAPTGETFPLVDEQGVLMGSFVRLVGDLVRGWVAGNGSPVALQVSTGESFYLTPMFDRESRFVTHGVVSESSLSLLSVRVATAQEQEIPKGGLGGQDDQG